MNTLFIEHSLYFPISHGKGEERLYFLTQISHAIHCSSNYIYSALWADTDIRFIVKTTAQSVKMVI